MRFLVSCSVFAMLALPGFSKAEDAADVVGADKPYAVIVERNVFGLLPIPPPPTNTDAALADPPPKITPNGIMTIFGRDQALFKVAVKPKPGQPQKDESYVLAEGERQDDIEVVKIDHEHSIVTFNNHGLVQELPLVPVKEGGGAGASHGPAVGGMGAFPRTPMTPAERANMIRERQQAVRNGMSLGTLPASNFPNPNQQTGGEMGNAFQSSAAQGSQNIEDKVMNAARQMAEIEQNRIATRQLVEQGKMPPLPPTLLTPSDAIGGPDGSPLVANPPDPQVPATPKSSRPSSSPIYQH